jgi:hypothetical protein
MHHQVNRPASSEIRLVVEPLSSRDDDIVRLAFRAERRVPSLLGSKPYRSSTSEAECPGPVLRVQRFSSLVGHPSERRSSLKVFLTSVGEGPIGERGCFVRFFLPRGSGLWWWIVRCESESLHKFLGEMVERRPGAAVSSCETGQIGIECMAFSETSGPLIEPVRHPKTHETVGEDKFVTAVTGKM